MDFLHRTPCRHTHPSRSLYRYKNHYGLGGRELCGLSGRIGTKHGFQSAMEVSREPFSFKRFCFGGRQSVLRDRTHMYRRVSAITMRKRTGLFLPIGKCCAPRTSLQASRQFCQASVWFLYPFATQMIHKYTQHSQQGRTCHFG